MSFFEALVAYQRLYCLQAVSLVSGYFTDLWFPFLVGHNSPRDKYNSVCGKTYIARQFSSNNTHVFEHNTDPQRYGIHDQTSITKNRSNIRVNASQANISRPSIFA